MNIDDFEDIIINDVSRRIERDGNNSREVISCTIVIEDQREFEKLYDYLRYHRMVYVKNFRYEEGIYYLRNFKVTQGPTSFRLIMAMDYQGKELVSTQNTSPIEFKHRLIVEEDFSGWETVSWPEVSAGVAGRQYEPVSYNYRESTGSGTWTTPGEVRPDGSTGEVLKCVTVDKDVIVEDQQEWNCYEVKLSTCCATGTGGSILFHVQDRGIQGTVIQAGYTLYYGSDSRIYLNQIEDGVTSEIVSWEVDLARDNVGDVAPEEADIPMQKNWYELMARCYGPIIEVFLNGKSIDHIKIDRFPAGTFGFRTSDSGNVWFSDFKVKRLSMPLNTLPVNAYNVDEFVHDAVHTKDGWVQRVIAPKKPVKYWAKSSTKGMIKVWDMMDGDFTTPDRWKEIKNISQEVIGDLFIENGIAGILYSGSRLYYCYHEHLKDVLVGFDASAWWSQGYSLKNIQNFKTRLSPSATKGSLTRHYQYKDPYWFLKPHAFDWEQNLNYDFDAPTLPDIESVFFLNSFKSGTQNTRIMSYNSNDPDEGAYLCAPNRKLMGGWAENATTHNTLEGTTILTPGEVYKGRFLHTTDDQLIYLDDVQENSADAENHAVNQNASPTLSPLSEASDTLDIAIGGVSTMIYRDRKHGHQAFATTPTGLIGWYTFDRADFDRTEGTYGSFIDNSGNDNHLANTVADRDPGMVVTGVYNEALTVVGAASDTVYSFSGTTGHTTDASFVVTFWIRFGTSVTGETGNVSYVALETSADVNLFQFSYEDSPSQFKVHYGNASATIDIPVSVLDDGKLHFIRVDGTYVYVDSNQYTLVGNSSITGAIGKIYVHKGGLDSAKEFTIDELCIYEDTYTEYEVEIEDYNYWKKYYYFQESGDFDSPILQSVGSGSATVICGNYTVRLESGNPLICIEDVTKSKSDLLVYPEKTDEWTVLAGSSFLADARRGEIGAIPDKVAHKYVLALHQKTANGFGVFTAVDAVVNPDDSRRARVHVNAQANRTHDVLKFRKANILIAGFQNWPLWYYFREGAQADTFNGAIREKDSDFFFSCLNIQTGDWPWYDFYSVEYGSYLLLMKDESGHHHLDVGDSDYQQAHLGIGGTVASPLPNVARAFNYVFGDLANDHVKLRIRVTFRAGSSGDKIDYLTILPLSNGLHYPLDFISQILSRNS